MGEHDLALKISNVVAYLAVLGVNVLLFKDCLTGGGDEGNDDGSSLNPLTNDTHKHEKPDTYLSPPEYAESIFGLIYLLLGGFVIYQWCPSGRDATIEGIKWHHVVASVLNISFVLVWVFADLPIVNTILSIGLLTFLSKIYHEITYYPPKSIFDRLFIHWSFTIYLAWITIETVNNIWITIPFLNTVLFSTIMIVIYGIIGLHFVDYYDRRDVVYAGTLVWGLVSIALKNQDEKPILISASIASGLIVGGIIRVWVHQIAAWYRLRNQRLGGEREPLLRTP